MKRRFLAGLALAASLLLCWGIARAQQAPEVAPPPPTQDVMFISMEQGPGPEFGPMSEHIDMLGFEGMHGGKVVTGAPFSATATSESVQTLADGSHITRKRSRTLSICVSESVLDGDSGNTILSRSQALSMN